MEDFEWLCVSCGGGNVQGKAWVDLNPDADDGPTIDWSLSENDKREYWCLDCREHVEVIRVETK